MYYDACIHRVIGMEYMGLGLVNRSVEAQANCYRENCRLICSTYSFFK